MNWFHTSHPAYVEGQRHFAAGEFADAEDCFTKALAELKARKAPPGRQGKVLLALAKAQWKLDKPEARENAETARPLLRDDDKPTLELAECLDVLASVHEKDGDRTEAAKLCREAIEIQETSGSRDAKPLIERFRHLASLLREDEAWEEAEAALSRALTLSEERLGTRDLVTAECLLDIGECRFARGKADEGMETMQRALEIHRESEGSAEDQIARDLQRIGAACHKAGQLEEAVKYYELALNARERQIGGDSTKVASLLMEMAEAYTLLGNEAPAVAMLQQAVGKLTGSADPLLGRALEGIAGLYGQWGRFDEAVTYYRKAKAIWEKDPSKHGEALRANAEILDELGQDYVSPSQSSIGGRRGGRVASAFTSFYKQADREVKPRGSEVANPQPAWTRPVYNPGPPIYSPGPPMILAPVEVAGNAQAGSAYPVPVVMMPPWAGMAQHGPAGEQNVQVAQVAQAAPAIPGGIAVPMAPLIASLPPYAGGVTGPPAQIVGQMQPAPAGLPVSFVDPQGKAVAPPPSTPSVPLQLTVVLPEGGVPKGPVTARVQSEADAVETRSAVERSSVPALEEKLETRKAKVEVRCGWDELVFDFLPLREAPAQSL
jgi:tetratricopeptide (TPR) repeat protein